MSLVSTFRYLVDVGATRVQFLIFVMGFWFMSNLFLGLMICSEFPTRNTHEMYMAPFHAYGVIPVAVNGWHALFHGITGLTLLIGARTRTGAIRTGVFVAVLYWIMAALGFSGSDICSVMAVDDLANYVHAGEGVLLISIVTYGVVSESANRPIRFQEAFEEAVRLNSAHAGEGQPEKV